MFEDAHSHLFNIAGSKDSGGDNSLGISSGAKAPGLYGAPLDKNDGSKAVEMVRRFRCALAHEVHGAGAVEGDRRGRLSHASANLRATRLESGRSCCRRTPFGPVSEWPTTRPEHQKTLRRYSRPVRRPDISDARFSSEWTRSRCIKGPLRPLGRGHSRSKPWNLYDPITFRVFHVKTFYSAARGAQVSKKGLPFLP